VEQREKIERKCRKLQVLFDNEIPETSFMWCSDINNLSITEDIFRKTKRLREVEVEDYYDENCIEINFDIEGSESLKTSLPVRRFEIDESESSQSSVPDNSVSPNTVPGNSLHISHRIYIQNIGNNVVLEVEGSKSPPSFDPYE
jgi:RNA recognition motif-containing protein